MFGSLAPNHSTGHSARAELALNQQGGSTEMLGGGLSN